MTPLQALDWERSRLPRQFTLEMTARPGPQNEAHGYWSDEFGLPPVPGVLSMRRMLVTAVSSPAGEDYVRVDAESYWLPARPAASRVPTGVTAIVITAHPNMNTPHDVPRPVTVTSAAKVREIIAVIDGSDMATAGSRNCPVMTGKSVTIAFLARVGGPELATASVLVPSCGVVAFSAGRNEGLALSDYGTVTPNVLHIAGVTWPGWSGPPPAASGS